ncbi:MAG: Bifunctional protein GlmU [archaeon ADurb.Bin336]|nr:MAG: Bifunctional protein GlmU [archaeon ADurb.Bin336]
MKAIILAAGFGTRMYPLTKNCAKALLPLKEKKVIDFILNKLDFFGEIIIVTNNKFYKDFLDWKKDDRIKIINNSVNNVEESKGWLEDLKLALNNEDFLVLSSDNVFDFDLKKMKKNFKEEPIIAVTKTSKENAKKHGIVELENNEVISFEEKPLEPKSLTKAILCYMIPKKFIPIIKNYKGDEHLIEILMKNSKVKAFYFEEYCHDIGCLESYKQAESLF